MKHFSSSLELSYTLIRMALGIVLVVSGYNKLSYAFTHNSEQLFQIGSTMGLFGISFGYLWWGYIAACTEFFGGLACICAFLVRFVALPLIGLFIVAIRYHLHKGDPFSVWGFAFICLSVSIALFIAGDGHNNNRTQASENK